MTTKTIGDNTRTLGYENIFEFTRKGGGTDRLVRDEKGLWNHPSFWRPIRHLSNAKRAIREKGIARI
jgi:hypothetical protein